MSDEIEVIDLAGEEDNNVRVSVPLHMLQGNMDVLKNLPEGEFLPCEGVKLHEHDRGVILVFTASPEQKEIWAKLGFRSVPTSRL